MRHLKLWVNVDKSGSGPSDGATLLGFRLHANGEIDLAPRSVERLKAAVRAQWDLSRSTQPPDADPHVRWCGSPERRNPLRATRSTSRLAAFTRTGTLSTPDSE